MSQWVGLDKIVDPFMGTKKTEILYGCCSSSNRKRTTPHTWKNALLGKRIDTRLWYLHLIMAEYFCCGIQLRVGSIKLHSVKPWKSYLRIFIWEITMGWSRLIWLFAVLGRDAGSIANFPIQKNIPGWKELSFSRAVKKLSSQEKIFDDLECNG